MQYARISFLSGLILTVGALVLLVLDGKPLLIISLVLTGLLFISTALINVLVHTTNAEASQRLTINDDTVSNPAEYTGIVEALAYFFFIK